jgi:hypothetical protein
MNRFRPLVAAGFVVLAGVYLAVRSPAKPSNTLPRWSCNHATPPVDEVPAGLLAQAGFRDRAALKRFVEDNRVSLTWTYFAVQSALTRAEDAVRGCFEDTIGGFSTAQARTIEARLTWHLASDGKTAVASRFDLAQLEGPPELAGAARTCLQRHLLGQSINAPHPARSDFVKFEGIFPFHRRLRFSIPAVPTEAGSSIRAPS